MTATRKYTSKFNILPTIGDGNCAFNAFVLALCEPSMLDQIEKKHQDNGWDIDNELKEFIAQASAALGLLPEGDNFNWAELKAELLRLGQLDLRELQLKLAPVLRAGAAERCAAADYCDNTIDALLD